jgi:hypothetical protein
MEKVMGDFLETYKKLHPQRTITPRYNDYVLLEDASWGAQDISYNASIK